MTQENDCQKEELSNFFKHTCEIHCLCVLKNNDGRETWRRKNSHFSRRLLCLRVCHAMDDDTPALEMSSGLKLPGKSSRKISFNHVSSYEIQMVPVTFTTQLTLFEACPKSSHKRASTITSQ